MNQLLSTLTGVTVNDPKTVIQQGWTGSSSYNTGCIISTNAVYSVSSGTVLGIEQDPKNNTWSVTVEINSQVWIRYCLLSACSTLIGKNLSENSLIGYANNGIMRFEYCTSEKSKFPVRVLNRQLYKHDPTPVIFGNGVLRELRNV